MPFSRPTIAALIARDEGFLVNALALNSPVLRRSVVRIVARLIAGASHMLHGHISYNVDQSFPDTADEENLIRQAALHNVFRNAAEYAEGPILITGVDTTVIPNETSFFINGVEYLTQAEATIGSVDPGEVTVQVEAVLAGQDGNADEGTDIEIGTPIVGVDSTATVGTGGLTGGTEQETIEDFRARFIEVLRSEELGGSDDDYINWAKEVPGVTRVWVYRHEDGLGTVKVRFVRDNDVSIIPDGPEVAAVQAKFDAERPTTAEVTAAAPSQEDVDFTIEITPDTAANRQLVIDELTDLFYRKGAPGNAGGTQGGILLAEMRTAIGIAVPNYVLTAPVANYVPALGVMGKLGTFTWV